MNKLRDLLSKTLVVGVIVLFIGVGIQPAFAVTPDTSDSVEDCNLCPKASKQQIDRLNNLLERLVRYDSQLSILSKHNPEIEEKYQELSNYINSDEPISIRPLCIFLEILRYFFIDLGDYFMNQLSVWMPGEHGLLYYIIPAIASFSIALMFQIVGVGIFCWKII